VEALLLQPEHVLFKFRELPGGQAAFVGQDVGRQHEGVAVLEVLADEVVEQRPFQPRAQVRIQPVAVAAHLDAALVVDEAQLRAQLHVVLRLEGPGRLFAVGLDHLIGFFAAGDDALRGEVGQLQQERLDFRFEVALFLVQLLDAVGHFLELFHQRGGVLAPLLHRGDFLAQAVALGLDRLVFGDQRAALLVLLNQLVEVGLAAPLGEPGLDEFRVRPDQVDVQHLNASFMHLWNYYRLSWANHQAQRAI